MLRNLKAIYVQAEDYPRALGRLELLLLRRTRTAPRTCATAASSTPRSTATASPSATSRRYLALRAATRPRPIELAGRIAALRLKAARLN